MLRPVHDVENVVNDAAFWVALVVGAAATVLVAGRLRGGHREPGVALAVVVACLAGLRTDHRLPATLVVGLAVLGVGEWLTRDMPWAPRAIGACPGALVLGAALPEGWPFWIRAVVTVSTIVGGLLVDVSWREAPRLVPLLLAIGAVGVYLCVPDTEAPKALIGALVAGAFIGLAPRLTPTFGATTLTGLFVWIAGYSGVGRPGSVVGAIACLGVVLLPAVWRRVSVPVVLVMQVALVVFVSRLAGFEDSAWSALALCVPAFAVTAGVLWSVNRRATS
jgi:hypothetical protein